MTTTNHPTPVELSDEKQIDRGALCEECEQWENNEDGNPRTFMVCGACWNKLQATNTALRKRLAEVQFWKKQAEGWIAGVEERETAVCPEDVGFDEYIRTLESRLAQVEQELTREKRLRSELKQIAQAGIAEVSSVGSALQANAVRDTAGRVATRMRERCVSELRALLEREVNGHCRGAYGRAIAALESLTLDGEPPTHA